MKYSVTRKINLGKYSPDHAYETMDFHILEADSRDEAMGELDEWIHTWLQRKFGSKPNTQEITYDKS
jgi:hypothetical protein